MTRYGLLFGSLVRWTVSPTDPPMIPALAEHDLHLLNPLVLLPHEPIPMRFRLADGRFHVVTNRLDFIGPEGLEQLLYELSLPWLRALRICSKQASLPTDPHGTGVAEFASAEAVANLTDHLTAGNVMGRYRVETGISPRVIAEARAVGSDENCPLYGELILDALLAAEIRRPREAILYSAIAVESLASHEIGREYGAALGANPPPPHLNIVDFPVAGGGAQRKDPVLAALRQGDNFGKMLHEIPLYLMRRSLLRDHPDLFKRATTLYTTRNKLSHGERLDNPAQALLSLDQSGMMAAVDIALQVFAWFGKTGYWLPKFDSVAATQ